jgi:hypothetical protein
MIANGTQIESYLAPNPRLARFSPLPRILCFDDFDDGINGWTEMMGNYEDSLDNLLPGNRDFRTPQLSNLTMWDSGSAGSYDGTYALKIATRPRKSAQAIAIKRLTFRQLCRIRVEAYLTFKPEATELKLSDRELRSFGFVFDLQNKEERIMPHLRYLNAFDGHPMQKWQYKKDPAEFRTVGGTGEIVSHYHFGQEGWYDLSGGSQRLCYNELPTKQNWHYFRLDFDLASMRYLELQCNDCIYDMAEASPLRLPAMKNLWCMLNMLFFVETDVDKRAFLYLDSVLLSGEC